MVNFSVKEGCEKFRKPIEVVNLSELSILTSLAEDSTQITNVLYLDLGGQIPASVGDQLSLNSHTQYVALKEIIEGYLES